jgi:membrane protease YdiL (CAAX protease family)
MPELTESEAPAEMRIRRDAVAPWPHTLFILVVLALWATYGAMRWRLPPSVMPHSITYTSSIIVQWLLAGATIGGLYHRRSFLMGVLGRTGGEQVFVDLAKGFVVFLVGWATVVVVGVIIQPLHLRHETAVVKAMAPHSASELALWLLVSLSVGVCEEFIFRGYLLQQFRQWFGSAWIAVGLSGLIFACMHMYEGSAAVLQIGGLGVFFGIVAVRRGNLRHVMIAHFLQDALTGLFVYLRR